MSFYRIISCLLFISSMGLQAADIENNENVNERKLGDINTDDIAALRAKLEEVSIEIAKILAIGSQVESPDEVEIVLAPRVAKQTLLIKILREKGVL